MSYFVHGKRYADYFPVHFATFHKNGTGPVDCAECSYHGKVGGIFMGYCEHCARHIYKGYRGPGMNKYSSVDIYRQINDNSDFFSRKVTTFITKKEREWEKYRFAFWIFAFILFFFVLFFWKINN